MTYPEILLIGVVIFTLLCGFALLCLACCIVGGMAEWRAEVMRAKFNKKG